MIHLLEFVIAIVFIATSLIVWFCLLMAGRADREASRPERLTFAAEPENPFSHQSEI